MGVFKNTFYYINMQKWEFKNFNKGGGEDECSWWKVGTYIVILIKMIRFVHNHYYPNNLDQTNQKQ